MPKTKISEYSTTNTDNSDIESINIAEGCAPSGINNAIRELMVHLKEFQTGSSGDPLTVVGSFVASGGSVLSGTNTLSGTNVISGNINSSGTNTFSGTTVISGSLTAPNTVTLSGIRYPLTDGTNGQIIQTNGSGVLSFTNAASGDVTTTGTQTLTNKTLTDPAIIGTILEDVYTISDGAAFEIDPGNGSIQLITLGASRTPKATNFAAGESVVLMVDDGTAYTLTWTDATFGGSGVVWKTDSGVAPTLNTSGYTVIVLWKVSTQIYGARVGNS